MDLLGECVRQVGDGSCTSFWHDVWLGTRPLKASYNRLFGLDLDKDCWVVDRVGRRDWDGCLRRRPRGGVESQQFMELMDKLAHVVIPGGQDVWYWKKDPSGGFTVRSARGLIDEKILVVDAFATRWNSMVPTKVKVFAWHLILNRIPTKVNLDRHGLDVGSIRCSIWDADFETINHLFFFM